MPDGLSVFLTALAMLTFWGAIGLATARRVLGPGWTAAAPALGWAVANAILHPALLAVGFTIGTLAVTAGGLFALALFGLSRRPDAGPGASVPLLALALAALLALGPAAAILPKIGAHGASLAVPIFDHAKIAVIDSLTRLGLPAINPVFGDPAAGTELSYYYLWHLGAAMAALATGASGWEADAAGTWFTAFAAFTLVMALATRLSGRREAAWPALLFCAVGSIRPVLDLLIGAGSVQDWLRIDSGLGSLLFQATWSPQHVQAALCAILATIMATRLACRPEWRTGLALALVLAAGYQSSLWIGGIVVLGVFALASPLWLSGSPERGRFLAFACGAGLLAIALSLPLLLSQIESAGLRDVVEPIRIRPTPVLGPAFDPALAKILDIPAFWTVLLPAEFPIAWPLGLAGLLMISMRRKAHDLAVPLSLLALSGLLASWLLVSTIGQNNDLGWRAILPPFLVLTAFAAAWLAARPCRQTILVALVLAGLGLPHTIEMLTHNARGEARAEDSAFVASDALWRAVRRHAEPAERVANNPLFLAGMTVWPINISWALMANRSSCYAGREMALPFAAIPQARREALQAQFVRIFQGRPEPGDLDEMIDRYDCQIAVVAKADRAWESDPFAGHSRWRLVESAETWRIYRAGPKSG